VARVETSVVQPPPTTVDPGRAGRLESLPAKQHAPKARPHPPPPVAGACGMGSGSAGVGGHLPLLDLRACSAGPVGAVGAVGLAALVAVLTVAGAAVGALGAAADRPELRAPSLDLPIRSEATHRQRLCCNSLTVSLGR
jgi:hypothetical protein